MPLVDVAITSRWAESAALGLVVQAVVAYESTIQVGSSPAGNAYIDPNTGTTVLTGGTGYIVTATSTTGDTYSITRAANGTITRSCANSGSDTACVNGSW